VSEEKWVSVQELGSDYRISNIGRIKSLSRIVHSYGGRTQKIKERILSQRKTKLGYRSIVIRGRGFLVHRLVATAFIPNPDGKPEVNHKDGDKSNNHWENLEWVTSKENKNHAVEMGNWPDNKGSKHGMAKLTEDRVKNIKMRIRKGDNFTDIAKDEQVCWATVYYISTGKTWRHVE
jgi:hypothetical protein